MTTSGSLTTYIYARFNDGVNTSDEETLTITKIDTTAPSLTLGEPVKTTKTILIDCRRIKKCSYRRESIQQ